MMNVSVICIWCFRCCGIVSPAPRDNRHGETGKQSEAVTAAKARNILPRIVESITHHGGDVEAELRGGIINAISKERLSTDNRPRFPVKRDRAFRIKAKRGLHAEGFLIFKPRINFDSETGSVERVDVGFHAGTISGGRRKSARNIFN